MESLAPPLQLTLLVRTSIECGESVRIGIFKYIQCEQGEYVNQLRSWLVLYDQGAEEKSLKLVRGIKSPYRRAVIDVLTQGLKGRSIYKNLIELEQEIKSAAERELAEYISLLPIKLLLPLLLFQFPAYLILILGPLIRQYMERI